MSLGAGQNGHRKCQRRVRGLLLSAVTVGGQFRWGRSVPRPTRGGLRAGPGAEGCRNGRRSQTSRPAAQPDLASVCHCKLLRRPPPRAASSPLACSLPPPHALCRTLHRRADNCLLRNDESTICPVWTPGRPAVTLQFAGMTGVTVDRGDAWSPNRTDGPRPFRRHNC